MIDLKSEPSLGTLVLTRDAVLKYTYALPTGMTFPAGSTAELFFTDRAGGQYNIGAYEAGTLSSDSKSFTWTITPLLTNQIPEGSNFEVFVTFGGDTYKVRYGRVVRKEVSYPLNPMATINPPLLYSDDMQRNIPGPLWLAKYGAVSMRKTNHFGTPNITGNPWIMGARNAADIFGIGLSLWSSATVMWYAPMQSDSIEISVKLMQTRGTLHAVDQDGSMTVFFASNSSMTKFLGVRFIDLEGIQNYDALDRMQVVYGTGPLHSNLTVLGSYAETNTPYSGVGQSIKIVANLSATNPFVQVYDISGATTSNGGTSPKINLDMTPHKGFFSTGAGYRYTGLMFQGSGVTNGPMVFNWAAKDAV